VEVKSLLKNSLGARIGPSVGTEYADLGAFRSRFVVAISSMSTFSTGWHVLRTSDARRSDKLVTPSNAHATAKIRCLGDASGLEAWQTFSGSRGALDSEEDEGA
jgi:hypothetical protein